MIDKLIEEIKALKGKESLFYKIYEHLNMYLGACSEKIKTRELEKLKEIIWEMNDIIEKEQENER